MLDRLPPLWRHFAFMVLPVIVAWAGTELVPTLEVTHPAVAGLVGVIVTVLAAVLTPLTNQYGTGSGGPPDDEAVE